MVESQFYKAVERMPLMFEQLMTCELLDMRARPSWRGLRAIYVFYDQEGHYGDRCDIPVIDLAVPMDYRAAMARLSRMVLPGIPHHVTQRGNRREQTFFEDGDYALYLDLLASACAQHGVDVWSYCLMPNHVHIIAVPRDEDGLARTFRHVHRHYTGYVNARMRVTGHLWQGRFSSVAMDEAHLVAALRYVALNPVRARLVRRAEDWRWSSVRAHIAGADDHVVSVTPALERVGDFKAFLEEEFDEAFSYAALRKAETLGRPIGSDSWLADMEARTGLPLTPRKRGPKPKSISGISHLSP